MHLYSHFLGIELSPLNRISLPHYKMSIAQSHQVYNKSTKKYNIFFDSVLPQLTLACEWVCKCKSCRKWLIFKLPLHTDLCDLWMLFKDLCVLRNLVGGQVGGLVFAQYCHVRNSLCSKLSIIRVELHGLRLHISEGLISVAKMWAQVVIGRLQMLLLSCQTLYMSCNEDYRRCIRKCPSTLSQTNKWTLCVSWFFGFLLALKHVSICGSLQWKSRWHISSGFSMNLITPKCSWPITVVINVPS